ncbi:MAG: hypothetical protein IIT56_04875 [Bacteroidales bacterium]|nr:hypothetical protein [Bacteroidales bacterium]
MKRAFINPKTFIAALLLSGAVIAGCSDDESFSAVDNQNPVVALESESIHWEFGKEFKIKAKIDDADGIKTINLKNSDLMLNNTIDILAIKGSECKSYDLDYKFTAPDSLKTETFPIVITVEDLVGNVSSVTFTANMDGDFTNPKFTVEPNSVINVIMSAFNFKFSVSDNRVIKKVVVNFPDLNINEEITNETKTYDYVKNINLGDENRDYTGYIAAYDEYDNEVKKEITISRGELADYERMYLCDVAEEDLITDVCGVPMLIDHSGEFEYTAYYYNEKAGTEIRFIPQKASYEPVCFGLDPDSGDKLNSDPSQAKPLVLNEAGVYYKIVFNTKQLTYSTSTYSVDKAYDPMPGKLGSDAPGLGLNTWCTGKWNAETSEWENADDAWWQTFKVGLMTDNPREVDPCFDYHPQNPHIIQILNCTLEKGEFEFHPHNWHHDGWWDYCTWKPEKATKTDPEIWKYVGSYVKVPYDLKTTSYNNDVENDNHCKLTIPKTGNYDIIFDIHLGRMKVVPSK